MKPPRYGLHPILMFAAYAGVMAGVVVLVTDLRETIDEHAVAQARHTRELEREVRDLAHAEERRRSPDRIVTARDIERSHQWGDNCLVVAIGDADSAMVRCVPR